MKSSQATCKVGGKIIAREETIIFTTSRTIESESVCRASIRGRGRLSVALRIVKLSLGQGGFGGEADLSRA